MGRVPQLKLSVHRGILMGTRERALQGFAVLGVLLVDGALMLCVAARLTVVV